MKEGLRRGHGGVVKEEVEANGMETMVRLRTSLLSSSPTFPMSREKWRCLRCFKDGPG